MGKEKGDSLSRLFGVVGLNGQEDKIRNCIKVGSRFRCSNTDDVFARNFGIDGEAIRANGFYVASSADQGDIMADLCETAAIV